MQELSRAGRWSTLEISVSNIGLLRSYLSRCIPIRTLKTGRYLCIPFADLCFHLTLATKIVSLLLGGRRSVVSTVVDTCV